MVLRADHYTHPHDIYMCVTRDTQNNQTTTDKKNKKTLVWDADDLLDAQFSHNKQSNEHNRSLADRSRCSIVIIHALSMQM